MYKSRLELNNLVRNLPATVKRWTGCRRYLVLNSAFVTPQLCDLGQVIWPTSLNFLVCKDGAEVEEKDDNYLIETLWKLNEIVFENCYVRDLIKSQ